MLEDKPNLKELLIYITQIEDKRQISKTKHKLSDIVVINLFAILAFNTGENWRIWKVVF